MENLKHLQIHKVLSLPKILSPNAIYLVADQKSQIVKIVVTDNEAGLPFRTFDKNDIKAIIHEELFNEPTLKQYIKQQKVLKYYLLALMMLLISTLISTILILAIVYFYLQQSLILDIHYILSDFESIYKNNYFK